MACSRPGPASVHRSGFTLIELVVVVAIVAVLAGLLLPAISQVKASAQASGCASNLRQLHMAELLYAEDWEGWIMPGFWGTAAYPAGDYRQYASYHVQPYLDKPDPAWNSYARAVLCPSHHPWISPWLGSYKMNFWISARCSAPEIVAPAPAFPKISVQRLPAAASTMMLYDSGTVPAHGGGHGAAMATVTFRHHGAVNLLFVDGHVAAMAESVFPEWPAGCWQGTP